MYTVTIIIGRATLIMKHLTYDEAQATVITEEQCGAKCIVEKEN
jgi:hypothetical protein